MTRMTNGIGAKAAARLNGTAADLTRKWRCRCGATTIGPVCINGHEAPWLTGEPLEEPVERVTGIVSRGKIKKEATVGGYTGTVTVEKGVPIPGRRPATVYPWDEMGVGDSFFVAADEERAKKVGQSIALSGRNWLRRNGLPDGGVTSRVVEGGVRIWRVR